MTQTKVFTYKDIMDIFSEDAKKMYRITHNEEFNLLMICDQSQKHCYNIPCDKITDIEVTPNAINIRASNLFILNIFFHVEYISLQIF